MISAALPEKYKLQDVSVTNSESVFLEKGNEGNKMGDRKMTEEENAELKERLKSANDIIKDLLYCTDGIVEVSIPEENRFLSVKKLKARAEKFLKECKE